MDDEQYSHLRRASRAILPQLNAEIESDSLVTFEGIYVYIVTMLDNNNDNNNNNNNEDNNNNNNNWSPKI